MLLKKDQKLKELIDRTKKIFPSIEIVNLFQGQYFFKIKNFTESINILSKFSFSQNRLNHEKLRCLIIAKSYDKLNQPKEAFEFFNKNNQIELSQKKNNIDKAQALKTISKRMNFFIPENINQSEFEINKNINKADQPVFLIGFPRSGTTFGSADTATNPLNPIKKTIGIITINATIKLFFNTILFLAA